MKPIKPLFQSILETHSEMTISYLKDILKRSFNGAGEQWPVNITYVWFKRPRPEDEAEDFRIRSIVINALVKSDVIYQASSWTDGFNSYYVNKDLAEQVLQYLQETNRANKE